MLIAKESATQFAAGYVFGGIVVLVVLLAVGLMVMFWFDQLKNMNRLRHMHCLRWSGVLGGVRR